MSEGEFLRDIILRKQLVRFISIQLKVVMQNPIRKSGYLSFVCCDHHTMLFKRNSSEFGTCLFQSISVIYVIMACKISNEAGLIT